MDFSNLNTYASWKTKLEQLLDVATEVLKAADTDGEDPVNTALHNLNDFANKCPYQLLTDIADNAVQRIGHDSFKAAAAAIIGLTDELNHLTKGISEVTNTDKATTSLMRFDAAKKAVDTTIKAVADLKNIRSQLDSSAKDEKKLGESIDALMADIQAIRNQIELLDHSDN